MEHKEDGKTGILTLARLQDEDGGFEEMLFFIYEDKLGFFFRKSKELFYYNERSVIAQHEYLPPQVWVIIRFNSTRK
ncbi:hypothetical protein [Halalkalibacter alkalisediminis]|uniref:Uncharacterized protein n=1 Tax=Halalkalibacter alkalisediminis TaxID=935616 RepID=A0ABV6NQ37_9BACI|nr:hypothetical protein [Halalkalibacter alkalisediminis]